MKAIGIDIGTTTVCGVVLDTATGALTHSVTADNDSRVPTESDASAQDPARILAIVRDLLAELLAAAGGSAACIGLSGQMHGILYLDAAGAPLSPLYTWQDARGNRPCAGGASYAQALMDRTGHRPLATGYGAVTHFLHTCTGSVPAGAAAFCTVADYIGMCLVGAIAPRIHPSHAAGIGLFCPSQCAFDMDAIRGAGMDPALFPPVADGFALLGTTAQGIPVAAALGDNQASFLGAVRDPGSSVLINVGTGGQISLAASSPATTSPLIEARPCTGSGDFLLVGSSLCAGSSYALLEQFFAGVVEMATGTRPGPLYSAMDRLVLDAVDPEEPLTVHTQFRGTRQDPELRGAVLGLSANNFTPRHLILGVLEGMVREFHDLYSRMELPPGHKLDHLVCSGNGVRRNPPLRRLLQRRFGAPLHIPAHHEEACYGAALYALTAAGAFPSLAQARQLIRYLPD